MVDRLEALFNRFQRHRAGVQHRRAVRHHGPHRRGQRPVASGALGRRGGLNDGKVAAQVHEPSLLLYPRPLTHRFITEERRGADFACANLRFEGGVSHPIAAAALPAFVCLPLSQIEGAQDADAAVRRSLRPALRATGIAGPFVRGGADSDLFGI
jgi:hypothetical protein